MGINIPHQEQDHCQDLLQKGIAKLELGQTLCNTATKKVVAVIVVRAQL